MREPALTAESIAMLLGVSVDRIIVNRDGDLQIRPDDAHRLLRMAQAPIPCQACGDLINAIQPRHPRFSGAFVCHSCDMDQWDADPSGDIYDSLAEGH